MMADPVQWTAIVLTCANKDWTHTIQNELELRKAKGHISKDTVVLTVEDPKCNVGSGGATVNALLTVTEYISAQMGYSLINPDVLQESRILILHNGRSYPYDSCGRAFMTLPVMYTAPEYDSPITCLDILIENITQKLAVSADPGVWISSTDMILSIPRNATIPWKECEACVITVPSSSSYCKDHGVYKIDAEGFVEDILYKKDIGSLECCERKDGKVPVVCSIVYFNSMVADKLLSFYTKPPLDACTYMGLDSGQPPIQLSLFFDVMLPMATGVTEEDFVSGKLSRTKVVDDVETENMMKMARSLLWKELSGIKLWACMVESGTFHYLVSEAQEHKKILLHCPYQDNFVKTFFKWGNVIHSFVKSGCSVEEGSVVISSVLSDNVSVGTKSVVYCCNLSGSIDVGKDCFIAGLKVDDLKRKKLKIADSMLIQGFNIHLKTLGMTRYVLTTHGRFDKIEAPMWKSSSTYCNSPWIVFLTRTGILKEDLWENEMDNERVSMKTAKLFPVFHATETVGLKEILWLQGQLEDSDGSILKRWRSSWRLSMEDILSFVDMEKELQWKRELFYEAKQCEIAEALVEKKNKGFRPIYNSAGIDGFSQAILAKLDSVARNSKNDPGVAARTLANIADILGCKATNKGGLRSGPAANKSWTKAFHLLEIGELERGIDALAKERSKWLGRPDLLVRAARHYEGAGQILIRQAVMTAKKFFKLEQCSMPFINKWVTAECPARIDVSGGWSDTPPITYEHGGAVTTVALLVNGKRPVGAKAKRIDEPKLVMVIYSNDDNSMTVTCQQLSDLEDYYQPHSPGALLKAAFICADIVNLQSEKTLRQQLMDGYGSGFEIHSWSNLPHGSGMGTSSILSGAVMAALLRASGKSCDTKGLIHAVLYLEQLLTTGGGWQDQVGGLTGGIKIGLSEARLPIAVDAVDLKVAPETVNALDERLVLIYTGKTRLARNLLQEVVRNWYARNPQIVETEDALVVLAQECAHAFIDGNLAKVGACLDRYWEMKKVMAPGCETAVIAKLMSIARPFAYGMCMAGAGGGGFMYVLTIDPDQKQKLLDTLSTTEGIEGHEIYEACVDMDGLHLTVENE